jgi:hypothetical protein
MPGFPGTDGSPVSTITMLENCSELNLRLDMKLFGG